MPHNGPFPSKEADLNNYYQLAVPYLLANAARFSISITNVTNLTNFFATWNIAFPPSQNKDTRTKTVTDNKNHANVDMQTTFRVIFKDIPDSALTPQDRNTLNLPEHSTTHTHAPVPTTKPVAKVDTSKHLEHTIGITDESTPTSAARPAGTHGCQLWAKLGSPVADVSELQYIATVTNSPYINHFAGVNAGKAVYYWLRWENTRGETGPWSDQVMATIAG